MSADKRPEWLPEGWTMRACTRETGMVGKIDRYYTSQASGYTCRSKVEVMRYLDIEKKAAHTTRSTSCFEKDNHQCYFDPFTGSWFYSKGEVLQYLKPGKLLNPMTDQKGSKTNSTTEICTSSNQKGSINSKFTDNCSPDGLPHGWIKEIKIRKTNTNYGARRDLFYTDPVNGYIFRSLKGAYHYIETGEVGRCTFRQKKRHMTDMYSSCPLPTAAKKRMSRGATVRRCLFSGQVPNSNVKMVLEIDESPEKPYLLLQSHHPAQKTEGADSSCLTSSNVEQLGKETNHLSNPSCRGGGISPQPLTVKQLKVKQVELSHSGDEKLLVLEDNDPSEERQVELMIEKISQSVHRKSRRGAKKRRGPKKRDTGDPVGSQKQESAVRLAPSTKAFKAITLPIRSSKRLAGLKADPVVNSGISDKPRPRHRRAVAKRPARRANPSQGSDQGGGPNQTSGRHDEPKPISAIDLKRSEKHESKALPGEQAAPSEQTEPRKLSGDRPISPFGDSWRDPCIQFAFETLTGDIPVIQDCFQQDLISGQRPRPSGSASVTIGSQTELHVQHRACSTENGENGLLPMREVNKDNH